jgi:transposase
MRHYAGLDVSLEETAICIVDETGKVMRELRAASEPDAVVEALTATGLGFERIGLEACSLSSWLHQGLTRAGLPALCIETRAAKAAMGAMPNKTDRNDARGLAQIIRTGWYRAVHVKSTPCRSARALLGARRTMLNKQRDIENAVRAVLREVGLKLGTPSRKLFAGRVRELASADAAISDIIEPLLVVLDAMGRQLDRLTKRVLEAVRVEPICRRLMTVPGVGPLTALAFRATVDQPARFRRSRDVGAHLGLTPRRYQSGETDIQGCISRCGDELARTALYEAAHTLLTRCRKWSTLKAWGMRVAPRHGQGPCCRRPQARCHPASHVERPSRVPLGQSDGSGSSMRRNEPVPA